MREFTIEDLIDILRKNIVVIILACICAAVAGFIYTKVVVTPLYESSAKIILVKQEKSVKEELANLIGASQTEITTNDVTLNQKLVSTYSEIIKSRSVLESVKKSLKLDIDTDDLEKAITVSPVEDTEVINIAVKGEDSKENANIANELVAAFSKEVKRIYNIDNVQVVDKAIPTYKVTNVSLIKNLGIFVMAAAVLVYGVFFLIEYLNNKVTRVEDLEELKLNILASIPDLNKMKGARR